RGGAGWPGPGPPWPGPRIPPRSWAGLRLEQPREALDDGCHPEAEPLVQAARVPVAFGQQEDVPVAGPLAGGDRRGDGRAGHAPAAMGWHGDHVVDVAHTAQRYQAGVAGRFALHRADEPPHPRGQEDGTDPSHQLIQDLAGELCSELAETVPK